MNIPDSVSKYKISQMNVYALDSVGHKTLEYSAVFNPDGRMIESYGVYDYSIDSALYEYNAERKLAKKYYWERRTFNGGKINERIVDGGYELTYRYRKNKIFTVSSRGSKTKEVKKAGGRQKTITRGRSKWRRSLVRKVYYKNGIEYGVEKQFQYPIRKFRKVIYRWQRQEDSRGCLISQKEIKKMFYKNPLIRRVRLNYFITSECLYEGFFLRKKKTHSSPGYMIQRKGIRRKVIQNEKGSTTEQIYEYIIRD